MKQSVYKVIACTFFLFTIIPFLSAQNIVDAQWKEVNGVQVPIPPNEHPRLYLRAHNIPELRERMKDPDLKEVWNTLMEMREDRKPEDITEVKNWLFYVEQKGVTVRAELSALEYLLTKNKKIGRDAITSVLDTLTSFALPKGVNDIARASGRMMVSSAIVYDWCYDLLKEDEKQQFINGFIRLAKTLECGYPPTKQNSITGHSAEWMIHRDLISAAIAIYDEHPEMYELAAGRFFKDHVPVRNWFYSGHSYHQGPKYDNVRFACDLFPLWIFDRMGAGNIYNPSQQFVHYNNIYKRRPDAQYLPSGDVDYPRIEYETLGLSTMLTASYYKDKYINYEFRRNTTTIDSRSVIYDFLWRDTKLGVKSPKTLPLTRYFDAPFGWMIARTGWGDNSVIAEMKVNQYNFSNHQHLDGGTFQIYYKGSLIIDSGAYVGSSGGYNSQHNKNYFKRTVAHNSLLVYDPNEEFKAMGYGGANRSATVENDGGQKLPGVEWGAPKDYNDLLQNFRTGEILAQGFGPDVLAPEYSYLKGDITQAYSEKVKELKRSFVFLNLKNDTIPAIFIVFDKVVAANSSFKKTWLLHSIEEPIVNGMETTIARTKNGDSGKIINTTLLPQTNDATISSIGGEGKEFWVQGVNYKNDPTRVPDEFNERGSWRIELTPKVAAETNNFLNVMQVMDNNKNSKLKVQLLEEEHLVGVQIANNIVTFSKNSEVLTLPISITVKGTETTNIMITDLQQGTWQVLKDGEVYNSGLPVSTTDGILYFTGTAGTYTLLR